MSQLFKSSSRPVSPFSQRKSFSFLSPGEMVVVLLCLSLGILLVGWRAGQRSAMERERALDRLQGPAARLKASLAQALWASEALAAHLRQGGGRLPGFQKIATEWLSASPGLVSLELLPGGIVAEVASRAGLERMIGYNAMRERAVQPAIQLRRMAITGPLLLPGGQVGLVGRWPVFLTDSQGREVFWGLTSASVALPPILSEAGLQELAELGYDYLLYALPAPPAKPISIAKHGNPALEKMVDQALTVANLELRLAARRRGGWGHFSASFLDSLGMLCFTGLLGYGMRVRHQQASIQSILTDATSRLSLETERALQFERQWRAAEEAGAAERDATQAAAEALRGQLLDVENQWQLSRENGEHLEKELRLAKETSAVVLGSARKTAETLQTRLREVELQLSQERDENQRLRTELQTALDQVEKGSSEALKAKESALDHWKEAEAELQRSRERAAQLQEELKDLALKHQGVEEQKEQVTRLQETLRRVKENGAVELMSARETAETLRAKLRDTEAELEGSREQVIRAKEELRLTRIKIEELTRSQGSLPESSTSEAPNAIPEVSTAITETPALEAETLTNPSQSGPPFDELKPDRNEPIPEETQLPPPPEPSPLADSELESIMDHSLEPAEEETPEVKPREALAGENTPEMQSGSQEVPLETRKPEKTGPRKRSKDHGQLDLFGEPAAPGEHPKTSKKSEEESPSDSPSARKPAHSPAEKSKSPPLPPLNKVAFKKHVTELYTLLAESDPGAQDCLADTREDLRPAFSPESFAELERLVRTLSCPEALQLLTKTARRHGINF